MKIDQETLIQLIMDKQHEYYRLAYVYLQNEEDALDVLQDMIVIVYLNISNLKKTEAFYSWSKTILVNCCRKMLKDQKKTTLVENFEECEFSTQNSYTDSYVASDHRQDILSGMKVLNLSQQEAIKLRYFLGMDYQSIAEITETPLGTVKSRISTGLTKLREFFGGDYR